MNNGSRATKFNPLSEPIWSFAFDAYSQYAFSENLVFSPFSVYLALCTLLEGAGGSSRQVLAELLHQDQQGSLLPDLKVVIRELNSRNKVSKEEKLKLEKRKKLRAELIARGSSDPGSDPTEDFGINLDIATGLWIQDSYRIHRNYKEKVQAQLNAIVENLDFQNNPIAASQVINTWIGTETRKRIETLLSPENIHPLTRMVVVNAIYFKGKWKWWFDEPTPGPFYLLDGTQVETQHIGTMSWYHRFVRNKHYWAVELPYDDRPLAMILIVPNSKEKSAFIQLEKDLPEIHRHLQLKTPHRQELHITMPQFLINANNDLSSKLSDLGIREIFGTTADFSFISSEVGFHINSLYHGASISVDRYGTEASAYTLSSALGYRKTDEEEIYLTADHPFYFELVDQPTGMPLFMGKVLNPNL